MIPAIHIFACIDYQISLIQISLVFKFRCSTSLDMTYNLDHMCQLKKHFLYCLYCHRLHKRNNLLYFFFGFNLLFDFSINCFGSCNCRNLLWHKSLLYHNWCYKKCNHKYYCRNNPYLEDMFSYFMLHKMKHLFLNKFSLSKGHILEPLNLSNFCHHWTNNMFLFSLKFAM